MTPIELYAGFIAYLATLFLIVHVSGRLVRRWKLNKRNRRFYLMSEEANDRLKQSMNRGK